jgi:hypothetical protein
MKGVIKPDHMAVSKYELLVAGMIPITATEIKGISDELQTVELPDQTVASGGNRKSTEFTMKIPMHHTVEVDAMEVWYRSAQDPVLPTYKLAATLIYKSISGNTLRTYAIIGLFPSKRTLPDAEMKNAGDMATVEWTMKADDIMPLG